VTLHADFIFINAYDLINKTVKSKSYYRYKQEQRQKPKQNQNKTPKQKQITTKIQSKNKIQQYE
jgi:hypothetical protein